MRERIRGNASASISINERLVEIGLFVSGEERGASLGRATEHETEKAV